MDKSTMNELTCTVNNNSATTTNLDFKSLHVIPQTTQEIPLRLIDFSCKGHHCFKPLKLLYTPQLTQVVKNKDELIKQFLPRNEAILQLDKLRQEFYKEQNRQYRLRRVPQPILDNSANYNYPHLKKSHSYSN